MPKIPVYEQQLGTPRSTSATVESAITYMPFTQAVNNTGAMIEQRGASLLQEYDTTRAYTAFNELRDQSRSKMAELMSREGIDAQGAQSEYSEYYKKTKEDVTKSTINAFSQRQLFDKLSQSHQAGDLDQLARHEFVEHKKYKTTVVNGYIATVERDIRENVNDDAKMDGMIYGRTEADGTVTPGLWGAIDALGSGIDRTAAKIAATQGARYAAMDELINSNPQRATIKLEEWKSELGDKYAPLKKRLEAQTVDTMLGEAFGLLNSKFGNNHEAKIAFVNNKENWQKLGKDFDYKVAKELDARFSGMAADRDRAESKARTDHDRAVQDNDLKTLVSLNDPNAKPVDVLQLARERKISEGMLKYALDRKESTTIDNPWVVVEAQQMVEQGQDVTQFLKTAEESGQLSTKTVASVGKHSIDEKSKRAMQYIDRALKPSEADKWSPDKHLKYADATRLYYAKIASGMDYDQAAVEVVRGYIDGVRRTLRTLPTPQGMTPDQKTDTAALNQKKAELVEKFRTRQITPEVYTEEMKNIDALIKIAEEEAQANESDAELEAIRKKRKSN